MQLLAEIQAGNSLSSGIYPSLAGEAAPLWLDCENVIFDDGGLRKAPGLLGLENIGARPTGLKSVVADGEARCFIGAGDTAYRYRTSDGLTNIGSFAAAGGVFQFLPWDTWVLINNTVDPIELWKNTGSSAPIVAPFNRANVLFGYQLQAFVGGTNNGGRLVEWSPVNNVDVDWTPTPTGTAGNLLLRELGGDIVAAKPLGGSIGIYSRVNAGIFTFIGGTSIYGFRKPLSGVSAISPYSVVSFGDRHFGMARENVFVTDLVSFQLIDEPAMRKYIADNTDWSRESEVYGWADWVHNMARWVMPKNGGGYYGIGFRVDKNTWTKFNDSVIAGEETGAFSNQLFVKEARLLRQDGSTANNDGAAFASFAKSKPLSLGNRNQFKRIMKISLDAVWTGSVQLKLGFSDHPNDPVTLSRTFDFANEIFPDQLGQRSEGVFVTMQIESSAAGASWKLNGCKIYGELTGLVT